MKTKSLTKEIFYKDSGSFFGINFPLGIDAKELALKLKEAELSLPFDLPANLL